MEQAPIAAGPFEASVMPHTPGPWEVAAGDNYRIESAAIPAEYPHMFPDDDLGRMVAMVGNRQPDFGAADAALIAAAPDLLRALQYAVEQVPELATVPGVAAALAKAAGHEA